MKRYYFATVAIIAAGLLAPFTTAFAAGISISSLSPGTTVNTGNEVYFAIVPSGFVGTPTYTVSDSASNTSVSTSDLNAQSGAFVWIPSTSDAGTHTITINASDANGDTASVSQTIVVNGPPTVSINSLSPGSSVNAGTPIFFSTAVSGFVGTPTYTVSDSVTGSTLYNSDINSGGGFSWTPSAANANDLGSHTITVRVSDASGDTASASTVVTVSPATSLTISSLSPGPNVSSGQNVSFTTTATGFSSPTFSVTDSSASGSTISPLDLNTSTGAFSWTPTSGDTGTHTITITATDSTGHTANASTVVTVNENGGASVNISTPSPSSTIMPGAAVTFTAQPIGFTAATTFTITDAFSGSSITSANLGASSGVFVWVPTVNDLGTHVLTVTATDSSGHSAAAQVTLTISNTPAPQTVTTYPAGCASAVGYSVTTGQLCSVGVTTTVAPTVTTSTNTTGGYTFNNYLSPGSSGADVTALQNELTQLGFYSGPVTGYYGDLTTAAVESFQSAKGIDSIGVVGPSTRAALNGLSGGSTVASTNTSVSTSGYTFTQYLSPGSSGADVTALQNILIQQGYLTGVSSPTGYYGDLTTQAVEDYQTAHGIDSLGVVGPATRASLNQ